MGDHGTSARPARGRRDPDASSAAPVDPANRGPDEHYRGENGADGAGRAAAENVRDAGTDGMDASKSRGELYSDAREAGIEGRSEMNKEQLLEALRKHRATTDPDEPAGYAAGRRPGVARQSRSEGQPTLRGVDSVESMRPPEVRRPDRCAVVYEGSGRYGEFEVVMAQTDGSRRTVARSAAFRAPRFGRPRRRGSARVAYELLVSRLEACGWRPVDSDGPWYELGFLRFHHSVVRAGCALVTVVRDAGQARFVAEELDAYGNPTPLMVSPPFGAPRLLRVRPSRRARAALNELVGSMESEGWNVGAPVGKEAYALCFWRPADTNWGPPATRSGQPHHPTEPR
jgi:hypothetical protein